MKARIFLVLFFLSILPLSAQTRARFPGVYLPPAVGGNTARIFLHPAVGGTAEEQNDFSLRMKNLILDAGCTLTNPIFSIVEEALSYSDFYIIPLIAYDTPHKENSITVKIYETRTNRLVNSYAYLQSELERYEADSALAHGRQSALPEETRYWFHLGVYGGGSVGMYEATRPDSGSFIDVTDIDFSFIAGLQARVDFLTWLGVQVEAAITMNNVHIRSVNSNLVLSEEKHKLFTLMAPILLKAQFHPGVFTLSPYFGVHFNIPLSPGFYYGPTPPKALDTSQMDIPGDGGWGFSTGMSTGLKAGQGEFFLDIRYSTDMADITFKEKLASSYTRSLVTFSLGFEYHLFAKRKKPVPPPLGSQEMWIESYNR